MIAISREHLKKKNLKQMQGSLALTESVTLLRR